MVDKPCRNCFVISYDPGVGMHDHYDDNVYGDWILGLTLGSGCTINFKNGNKTVPIYLEPRSAYLMTGDARYKWTHGIVEQEFDIVKGEKKKRGRRISMTFREKPRNYNGTRMDTQTQTGIKKAVLLKPKYLD